MNPMLTSFKHLMKSVNNSDPGFNKKNLQAIDEIP